MRQTIDDCLSEAMDINELIEVLKRLESGHVQRVAHDLPEPSPLAHEILNARPYAFLDNAPLEERRTQAVYTQRSSESASDSELGVLDLAAIERVCAQAWPRATNPDELHEALLLTGAMTADEIGGLCPEAGDWLQTLASERRAGIFTSGNTAFWTAAERLPMLEAVYPEHETSPPKEA